MSLNDAFVPAGDTAPDGFCSAEVSDFIVAPTCNLIVKQSDGAECLKWNSVKDRSKRPVCKYTDENGKTTRDAEIVIVKTDGGISQFPYEFAIFDPRTDTWMKVVNGFRGVFLTGLDGHVSHWAELPPLPKEGTE